MSSDEEDNGGDNESVSNFDAHIMNSEEDDNGGDSDSVLVLDGPGNDGVADFVALMELTNNQNVKPVNWRTIDSDIALAEEVQKAEAHLAPRGKIGSKFKKVRHELNVRGYHVESHRTVQTRLKELLDELEAKNFCGKDLLDDKEEELKSRLKDIKDQMVAMEKKKDKENLDPKEQSKEGQFIRDQSALLVLGEALQRVGGSKLILGKDGQIMAETMKGGVPINVASLLFSNEKAKRKKGGSELVQSLLDATGHNMENKKEIEFRKLDLTIEQSKHAQEERKMQHELEMKKLEMEMVERRVMFELSKQAQEERRMQHDLEMRKLEMEMAAHREEMAEQREATRLRMLELEERLHRKNEK
jgi:hypothetical protein